MQWFKYQHNDNTDDYAVYNQFRGSNVISLSENQDWLIMLARTNASKRGANPIEIQQIVASLNE